MVLTDLTPTVLGWLSQATPARRAVGTARSTAATGAVYFNRPVSVAGIRPSR